MLTKFRPLGLRLASLKLTNVRCAAHNAPDYIARHPKEIFITTRKTINDLPVPEGDWQENYTARIKKWNMMLAASVGFFVFTMILSTQQGLFKWMRAPDFKKLDIDPTRPLRKHYEEY